MVENLDNLSINLEQNTYDYKLGDENYDSMLEKAETFKNEGNVCVKENKLIEAINLFTKAIDLKVETIKNSIYYSNRAFINIKIENYGLALSDANKAIEIDSSYIKAYYRRASSYLFLRKYDEALKDLLLLQKHFPDDADILSKINNTKAEKKKKLFAECISTPEVAAKELFNKSFKQTDKSYNDMIYESDNKIDSQDTDDKSPAFNAKIDEEWIKKLCDNMKEGKFIHPKYLSHMIYDAKCLLDKESTLVDIPIEDDVEFSVCGDTHGQYYDLLNIFKVNGNPSKTNPYLFNGDFVDRGSFSVEVVITLTAWKIMYPKSFYLSRGNHESKNMNKMYGFEGEVVSKYNPDIYEQFSRLFCSLPLAHVLNKKVFVTHGGLFSKDNVSLDDIRQIDRKREPAESGLMCEILWSDPCKEKGRHPSKRGVGVSFGPDITAKFLEYNGLEMIVRSHEVKQEGYEVEAEGKLVTVFSAPNYCDQMGNKGALIRFKGSTMKPRYVQFGHVDHPKVPPMKYANPWMMF